MTPFANWKMQTRNIFLSVLLVVTFAGGYLFYSYVKAAILQGISGTKIIYASRDPITSFENIATTDLGASKLTQIFESLAPTSGVYKTFLSPNGKYIAVTSEKDEAAITTYISDINGKTVTAAHPGRFESWSPDSSRILLYLSGAQNEDGRRIYYLDLNNSYKDSGLPIGVVSASISPINQTMVYSETNGENGNSDIYLRDQNGTDTLLVKGDKSTYAWLRFSPDGKQIAYLKSDLYGHPSQQTLQILSLNDVMAQTVSDVTWNYPALWSPDSSRLLFIREDALNVWEYNVAQKALAPVTHFEKGTVQHPSYSTDGGAIVFSYNILGDQQIWELKNGQTVQQTSGSDAKDYPVLP